jgi:hypothetical protein
MISSTTKRYLRPITFVAAIAITAGCNEETTTANAPADPVPPVAAAPMSSYSGPGSNWNVDLNEDGSYAASHSVSPGMPGDLSISGSYQQTTEGFISLTIEASSGDDAPVRGNKAWALEIPNHALFLSPVSTNDDHGISLVGGGECPNSDSIGNWINVRAPLSSNAESPEGSYFGSFAYTYANGSTVLTSQFALTVGNPDQGEYSSGNGFCRDGIIQTDSSDIYLSATGGATAHVNAAAADGGMIVFALPRATIGSISDLDGSYAGMIMDEGALFGEKVSPVIVTCNSGLCSGDFVNDVDAGTMAGQPFTVDLSGTINEPGMGLTTGELSLNGATGNIGCMVDPDNTGSGQRTISCAAQSPSQGYQLLNLILVSND